MAKLGAFKADICGKHSKEILIFWLSSYKGQFQMFQKIWHVFLVAGKWQQLDHQQAYLFSTVSVKKEKKTSLYILKHESISPIYNDLLRKKIISSSSGLPF